jgi:hypothetical protein
MSGDPLFVDAPSNNYRLQVSSPCIDAGYDPSTYTGDPCCDFDQHPRLLDKDGDGSAQSDMGAFEYDNSSSLIPGEVENVRFSPGDKDLLLWDAETDSESYSVYGYYSLNYDSTGTCLGSTTNTQFDITGLDYDHYLVTAVDEDPEPDEEGTLGLGTCAERSNFSPCP